MTKPDMALLAWTKSSLSGDSGSCVEIARAPELVFVRDSRDPTGPALTFTRSAWRAFVTDPPSVENPG
ncbi:DUF397 domain-containing protein [Phytohabitans suffuscus]|nr:DUF397 domain-containing protein [Phytohabitans suffuscus]